MTSKVFDKFIVSVAEIDWVCRPTDCKQTTRYIQVKACILNDTARCKRNVIVSSLPETDIYDDRTEFLRLCEENLTVKPSVSLKMPVCE